MRASRNTEAKAKGPAARPGLDAARRRRLLESALDCSAADTDWPAADFADDLNRSASDTEDTAAAASRADLDASVAAADTTATAADFAADLFSPPTSFPRAPRTTSAAADTATATDFAADFFAADFLAADFFAEGTAHGASAADTATAAAEHTKPEHSDSDDLEGQAGAGAEALMRLGGTCR